MRFALLVAATLALSGCIGGIDEEIAPAPTDVVRDAAAIEAAAYAKIKDLMAEVPCEAPSVGAATSANLLGLSKITFEKGGTASLDFKGNIMVAAGTGMHILDITDPLAPELRSTFGARGFGDVKISPDGMTAIGGNGTMIDLIDIRDPANPVRVGQWDLNSPGHRNLGGILNAHMLYTALIKEEQWVFLAPNTNTGVWILKLTGPPEARELTYVAQTLPVEGGPIGPHDMWATYDEDLKKHLVYSADGFHGWAVFDVSDPTKPMLEGGLLRPESGYTHTIQAAKINGKRIVATIAEVGLNVLEVYDASNLKAPILLGAWHVNEDSMAPQPAAPQHEFNIVGGKLYLGHYANGFYVFDLTKVALPVAGSANLRPVAHYAAGTPGATVLFSDIWSVDVIEGVLYASDMSKGIAVIGYGCNEPGDKLLTSTG